jgi:dUTP pyrophosphatase
MMKVSGGYQEKEVLLKVEILDGIGGYLPTIGYEGEDLGYDLYSAEEGQVPPKNFRTFRTGIAVEFLLESEPELKWGFIAKERSSVAQRGVFILGGCIDAGYRGEIALMLGNLGDLPFEVKRGQRIANLIPIPVAAKTIRQDTLSLSMRGSGGFGSTDGSNT